jgi:xanthine dehydrogenase large subunit
MPAPLETQGTPQSATPATTWVSGEAIAHDSAERHVLGTAIYIDDMPEPAGTVHWARLCRHPRPDREAESGRSAPPMASRRAHRPDIRASTTARPE